MPVGNKQLKSPKFPPSAYISLTGKKILKAFEQGHKPSKDISIMQLFRLSDLLREAAQERQARSQTQNEAFSGGVQHTTVTLDRAQLTFVVACLENYVEPVSCKDLTNRLSNLRDSLVGDAEEEESAPYPKTQ